MDFRFHYRHNTLFKLLILISTALIVAVQNCVADDEPTASQLEFFEKSVRPLLIEHCYSCHSTATEKLKAGLFVDSRAALLRGGESGAAIVPHDADASLLIQAVRYESFEMPPKGKLGDSDIRTLEKWIEIGAPWLAEAAVSGTAETTTTFDLQKRKSEHWVWQPVQTTSTPTVLDTAWPRNYIDNFILARLESAGLRPVPDADRNALVRRLYFDLIGLPPTSEQVQAFVSDLEPNAIERVVDPLLDSPRFGERWGRHWLDLVRYAESRGHEFDNDSPNAFQYRDYVIRSFNADVPYDQFVREQIAGDLLSSPRLNPSDAANESILGTGFWFLGEWAHSPVDIRKDETDRFDNMIDVMSKTFLGVTVACARCHDHKFDAISTADYYSLAGFLQSSDYRQVRFESIEHNKLIAKQLAELDAAYRQQIERLVGQAASLTVHEPIDANILVDYANLAPAEYRQDGFLFGSRPQIAGQPYIAEVDGLATLKFQMHNAAASDSFWDGMISISEPTVQNKDSLHSLPRSGRTLRTPTFTLQAGSVACRVRGSGHVVACVDSHRLVAGPLHGETIEKIKADTPWVRLNLDRYVGHRLHLEFTPAENSPLEVSCVVQGASPELLRQLEQRELKIETAVEQHSQAIADKLTIDAKSLEQVNTLVQTWSTQRATLRRQVRLQSQLAMAMLDGTSEDEHVLIRGSSANPGKIEPRHFLTAISGDQPLAIATGSGRLELAEQINDPTNPLAARVMVNRVWHWLIGRGIVPTTDDFGVLGQRPSHPELLDHLASKFIADDRSIKKMIRYIVLSRTYQMSSRAEPAAMAVDPKNTLWHHRPLKRLEGEVIRDALLAISGSLDEAMYGISVPVHLTAFMDGRGRPGTSGPLDGNRRRSIYQAARRNFVSPFMLTFDTPTPFSTMGRRNVSNVPAQALILMNDPLVVEQTSLWSDRVRQLWPLDHNPAAIEIRVDRMYQAAFARHASAQEQHTALAFLLSQAGLRDNNLDNEQLWHDLAHALVNTKEFIFLR